MGKIEDMRRLREEQYAAAEKRRAAAPKVAPPPPPPPKVEDAPAPSPPKPKAAAKTADAEQGKCPECGKMKPLQNGVMASHQKGFGKACAGTRKNPV